MCFSRALGNMNFLTVSFLPSFLSSLSAIVIERPSRRPLLCLYVSNVVSRLCYSPIVDMYFMLTFIVFCLFFSGNRDAVQNGCMARIFLTHSIWRGLYLCCECSCIIILFPFKGEQAGLHI